MGHEVHPSEPHQMHRFARNRRLYEHLMDMGLVVAPILVDGDPERIDCLVVAAAPWKQNVDVLPSGVGAPLEGAEVVDAVVPAPHNRKNVVDFPTVIGVPVSVHRERD